ncbi:MAG: retron Ec78 anti-phage system effector HNH endonuclease PtuB [Nitrosomonas sp.]
MHKLQRGIAPACLANYKHGQDNWNNVTFEDKAAIWKELDAMQVQRCAYCEATISNGNRHIEHFHQKGPDPKVTFHWPNLFGSCNRAECCGKHKDQCGHYNPTDLLKPDESDPEHYLVFAPDGSVNPRENLSSTEKKCAIETIRIFNLNGTLKQIRFCEIAGYIQTAEEFASMANNFPEAEWLPLLQEELATIINLPFATAIKHILTSQAK